jgi:hypothetical protein
MSAFETLHEEHGVELTGPSAYFYTYIKQLFAAYSTLPHRTGGCKASQRGAVLILQIKMKTSAWFGVTCVPRRRKAGLVLDKGQWAFRRRTSLSETVGYI